MESFPLNNDSPDSPAGEQQSTPVGVKPQPIGVWLSLFILLVGIGVAGFGGFRLAAGLYDEATLEPAKVIALRPGESLQVDGLQLDATRKVRFAVALEFLARSVTQPNPEYLYPFNYKVIAADGSPVFEEQGRVSFDQGVRIREHRSDPLSPTNQVEHRLQLMSVPHPGMVDIEFNLAPDTVNSDPPLKLSLLIYEGASHDVRSIIIGGSLLLVGGLVMLFSLVMLLVQALGGHANVPLQTSAGGDSDPELESELVAPASANTPALSDDQIRNLGMLCHLSALAGMVFPLGSVLGPLVVWLTQRHKSPFVDDQGKEAVNFQLSVLIYGAVCALLILILVGFFLLLALALGAFVLTIIAAIQANQGVAYRYPLIIRFIR